MKIKKYIMKRSDFLKLSLAIGTLSVTTAIGAAEILKSNTDYRYIYALEQPYYDLNGKYISNGGISDDNKATKVLHTKNTIGYITPGSDFTWNGTKFNSDLDLILDNYKGIVDIVAHG